MTIFDQDLSTTALLQRFAELPPAFFNRPATTVARALLGKGLLAIWNGQALLCEIVETEAYRGEGDDPASHCHRGMTRRNQSMFAVGGTCYVYLSYGSCYCMNVVTGKVGVGSGVLLRAAAPLIGAEQMAINRGLGSTLTPKILKNLLSGPGKLTRALGIDARHDGQLFAPQSGVALLDLGKTYAHRQIAATPRIGISVGTEHHWRYVVKHSQWLSRKYRDEPAAAKITLP